MFIKTKEKYSLNYYITITQNFIFLFKYKEQVRKSPELSFGDCNIKGEPKVIKAMRKQKQSAVSCQLGCWGVMAYSVCHSAV